MPRPVGIDLGTCHSAICVLEHGEPTVIANAEGSRTTPSVVAFAKNGEVLVGEVAKRQAVTNVERTIGSVKRHMGTDWKIGIDDKQFTPQQISAFILHKLKRDAESYLSEKVTDAVITVPASFSDSERQATKEAGEIAGLNVLRIVNEPTAAALAYGLHQDEGAELVLVVHFGGGTFDVSLVEVGKDDDGFSTIEVKATHGDSHLGGDDWDDKVVEWLVARFNEAHSVDLSQDKMAVRRLREAGEKAKIELSGSTETNISLPYIAVGAEGPLHLEEALTRADFQELTADLLGRCRMPFHFVLNDADVSADQIDHVVLAGGATRMPAVVDLVRELTGGKEPISTNRHGEAGAVGAAVLADAMKAAISDVLLLDVVPLSLGIEADDGMMITLIDRNTTIPTRRSEIFSTSADNQDTLMVEVFQGERALAAANRRLGVFEVTDLPAAPQGLPQIEVTFDLDADGTVDVSAKDLATGQTKPVVVTGGSALPKEDLERMTREAEQYAADDERRHEAAEARNESQDLIYSTETFLQQYRERIPDDVKSEVEAAIAATRQALESQDACTIRSASDKLATTSQKIGEALYR